MSDEYIHARHSKYMLQVHLIFVTKYRKKLLYGDISEDVKQYMFEAAQSHHCTIIQMETDKDHIHVLIQYPASCSVAELVGWLKQYSTYMIWNKYHTRLSQWYWKKLTFWSDGYFACSIGKVSQSIIENYIQNQG